ncbi:probable glutamate receptor [Cherax quadricarinatus]|uniref:probable glutamate receptor n=1 Tax=Cherax quadricarinatus TaxID=27406 RepID=UPI00387ED221
MGEGWGGLRQVSSYTIIVVISDDPAFLAAFFEWSLKVRLLVWSTRLLAVTRLRLPQLQLHYTSFSKMNAILLIINGKSTNIRCKMYIHLPYSPSGTQPLWVASWTPGRGFLYTSNLPLFPEKFSRFQHRPHLLVASEGNAFHKMKVCDDPEAPGVPRIHFTGPMAQLLDYLAKALNFSYSNVRPPDGFWGAKLGNGSWSGMVGMVMREEVQLATGPFLLSGERREVVDFTVPPLIDSWKIIGPRGHPEVDPWGFLFPLAPLVWAFILGAIIVLGAAVFLMSFSFSINTRQKSNWLLVTFDYIRILLQQDIRVPSYWWWERVVLVVWMMGTLVLTRSYSGNLMALLAVRHISEPYQSRRQVLDDPTVTMIWMKGSGLEDYLKSVESGIYWEMANAEKIGRLIWRTQAQFPGDVNTLVRGGHHVLMDAGNGVIAHIAQDFSKTGECSFYCSREGFLPLIFGMISSQNNPLIPALNKRIMGMTEAGLFYQWLKTTEPNSTVCVNAPTKITVRTNLSISNIRGMFIILVVGYVAALMVFFLERLCQWIQQVGAGLGLSGFRLEEVELDLDEVLDVVEEEWEMVDAEEVEALVMEEEVGQIVASGLENLRFSEKELNLEEAEAGVSGRGRVEGGWEVEGN